MRKAACVLCFSAWLFLQSAQAQSGPDTPRLADNEPVTSVPSRATHGVEFNHAQRTQQFVCTVGISLEKCRQEMPVLRKILASYPSAELGPWTWVLVRSEPWKLLLIGRGINSGVPALTALDARTTFFEEALISGPAGRVDELTDVWHVDRDGLLDLAVRHELAHALCGEENEWQAARVAGLLKNKQPVTCKGTSGAKEKPDPHASLKMRSRDDSH
jgi:hypothetical protein